MPELHGICGDKHPWECSVHLLHTIYTPKQLNHQPKVSCKADEVYSSKNNTKFWLPKWRTVRCHHAPLVRQSVCSGGRLPQEEDIPLQDFGPKIGGVCPRVGLYLELYGTYSIHGKLSRAAWQ